jgi:hypothetical protein
MNYGKIRIFLLVFTSILLAACSPIDRYNRLIDKYPFLVESKTLDSIKIVEYFSTDSTFFWNEIHDTITIDGIRLVRFRDTFRITTKPQYCTTFIKQTINRPSKETIKEKERDYNWWIKAFVIYMIITSLVLLLRK